MPSPTRDSRGEAIREAFVASLQIDSEKSYKYMILAY
ncbi:hypothetical protein ERY430_60230 [Erythrobacter sp. EC-HK427]|nr:hypothetical protein ERY430_60230 [Erythrobacter sp. EC-HK427]